MTALIVDTNTNTSTKTDIDRIIESIIQIPVTIRMDMGLKAVAAYTVLCINPPRSDCDIVLPAVIKILAECQKILEEIVVTGGGVNLDVINDAREAIKTIAMDGVEAIKNAE